MKYLCLVYLEDDEAPRGPRSRVHELRRRHAERGPAAGGGAPLPRETAKTVRVRGGRVSITDGPFAETKEQLAGFYLIDAANHDEALKIAATIPPAREGSIEVRPVRELQP